MKVSSTKIKRSLMVAVLGVVVYQGFLTSAKAERYMRWESQTILSQPETVTRDSGSQPNAAALYLAAMELNANSTARDRTLVDFNTLKEQEESVVQALTEGRESLELLHTASSLSRCHFGFNENPSSNSLPYMGGRRLVQLGCLQMMVDAKAGRHQAAVQIGHELATMIARLEASPTAITHVFDLSLAEQLFTTTTELQQSYPDQGYGVLKSDLSSVAKELDRGFRMALQNERRLAKGNFEQLRAGVYKRHQEIVSKLNS